jgi:hypothetical protein
LGASLETVPGSAGDLVAGSFLRGFVQCHESRSPSTRGEALRERAGPEGTPNRPQVANRLPTCPTSASESTPGLRVLGGRGNRKDLHLFKIFVNELDGHRAFADRRGNTLHGTGAYVAGGKYSRVTGL